jgi:hypothetical protein
MLRRRVWRSLAVATVALLACEPACKRQRGRATARRDDRPALGAITVKPIPTVRFREKDLHLDEAHLAAAVKQALEASKTLAEGSEGQARVNVFIEAVPFTQGNADDLEMGVRLRLRMMVRPEGTPLSRFEENTLALGQAPLQTKDAEAARRAFDRLVERTTRDLIKAYARRQKLWSDDEKEIEKALASEDEDLRLEALRVVREHRLRAFAPAVLRLLEDDDENVRDAALGTAVELEERRAVKVLTESRAMRDGREMRKILDAIASLGGEEAREYLQFVAETHDDDEVREMAKAALERLSAGASKNRPTR